MDTKLTFEAQDTLRQSIAEARETNRPSLIACRTIIGYGAPCRPGSKKIHGAPLGGEEIGLTRQALHWLTRRSRSLRTCLPAGTRSARAAAWPGIAGSGEARRGRARGF